jgi:hypothetical protein
VPEFDPGVGRCEVPTCLGVFSISIALPGTDFLDQRLLVRDAAVEALRDQDAELGFGEIKPTAVLESIPRMDWCRQAGAPLCLCSVCG